MTCFALPCAAPKTSCPLALCLPAMMPASLCPALPPTVLPCPTLRGPASALLSAPPPTLHSRPTANALLPPPAFLLCKPTDQRPTGHTATSGPSHAGALHACVRIRFLLLEERNDMDCGTSADPRRASKREIPNRRPYICFLSGTKKNGRRQ